MMLEHNAFLEVVKTTPLVAIDLLVTRADEAVLLGLRNNPPAQGYWFVPGGRIRKDERLADALARIVRSELGADVPVTGFQPCGFWEHLYADNFAGVAGVTTHYLVLAHEKTLPSNAAVMPDAQHEALAWWSLPDLLVSDQVHENTKVYFRD